MHSVNRRELEYWHTKMVINILDNLIMVNCMELARKVSLVVTATGDNSKKVCVKVTEHSNSQIEKFSRVSYRKIHTTGMELKHNLMDLYIMESSEMIN